MAMFFPDNYVVIDIETTGFEATSEIIELAAVKVVDNEITETFETLVKPKKAIQSNITEVTAITNAMVENAPPLDEVSSTFFDFIGDSIVVGHNIDNFDLKIIAYNTNHCIMNQTIDTLKLAKEILTMKHYTLQDVCNCYCVNNKQAHRALSDVVATHECYQHMKKGTEPVYCEPAQNKKHFRNYNCSEETKALQQLQQILTDVASDGILSESEVTLVKQWLDDNMQLSGNYPFDVAYSEIQKALEDDILEQSELNSLLKTFIKLVDPMSVHTKNDSELNLNGITVCLSGEFKHGTKEQVSELLVALGASVKETVTKKVGLLIVGDNGSADWRFGNYGGKVKKAMEMQEKGIDIKILGEAEFYEKLEEINT